MSHLTAVTLHDVTHCFNFSDSSTAPQIITLCVVCTAVIGDGKNRTLDRGSGIGKRKLRNEEFDNLYAGNFNNK